MRIAIILYGLAALTNLYATWTGDHTLNQFTKPLLMPLLIYLVFLKAKGRVTLSRLLLAMALVFAWGGDLLLMWQNQDEWYFIGGLGSFLVMQLLYTFVFRKSMYATPEYSGKLVFPVAIMIGVLMVLMVPHADGLKVPISIYALCIATMLLFALLRRNLTSPQSYVLVLVGASLFVISDALIGANKFLTEIPRAPFWIMLTYIPAQYLIVTGIMKHEEA